MNVNGSIRLYMKVYEAIWRYIDVMKACGCI